MRCWIRTLPYRGTARFCNVCGKRSGVFAPAGVMHRPDARCVFCGSLERHRFLWRFFGGHSDFLATPPGSLLHFAPEDCLATRLGGLIGQGYVTGDIERGLAMVQLDISELPFRDQSFDAFICSHVLEHVHDDRKAMRELARILKSSGRAVAIVPIKGERTVEDPSVTESAERLRLFGQEDHVRVYGADVVGRFEEAGFSVTKVRPTDIVSSDEREMLRIPSDCEPLFILQHSREERATREPCVPGEVAAA